MKTIVLQTFRTDHIPEWLRRCLASVRGWALAQGYEYAFRGDEMFALCGDAYLRAAGGDKRTITNLVRLEWIRASLAAGYDRAIWLDADTFVFDPDRFDLDVRNGYACAKEAWVYLRAGRPMVLHGIHNAALVFAGHHPDLDRMIDLVRYVAATRPIEESLQVGVRLLTGLHAGFRFPLLTQVGMLGPDMVRSLARGSRSLPRHFARENGAPIRAANLCWSHRDGLHAGIIDQAMQRLEQSSGDVINRFLDPDAAVPLLVPAPGSWARPLAPVPLGRRVRRLVPRPMKDIVRRLTPVR